MKSAACFTLVVSLLSDVAFIQAADKMPAIPGATSQVRWDAKTAPFDVKDYLRLPNPKLNAAPLYLDALFEFSTEVGNCFSEEERLRRDKKVRELGIRYTSIARRLRKKNEPVVPPEIDALVTDYKDGFAKRKNGRSVCSKRACRFRHYYPTRSRVAMLHEYLISRRRAMLHSGIWMPC